MNIALEGGKALVRELQRVERELERKLRTDLRTAAKWLRDDARKNIGGTRESNPLSKLGEVTGRLRQSITYDVKVKRGFAGITVARAEIGPEGWPIGIRARVHELGLKQWPTRPFLAPALARNRDRIFALFGKFRGLLR